MRPGDLVKIRPADGTSRLKAWSARGDTMNFFMVPEGSIGTVIEAVASDGVLWCKVLLTQGIGWIMANNLEVVC